MQRLIDRSARLQVDGGRVSRRRSASRRATASASICPIAAARAPPAAETLPLDVRYEDDALSLSNKPAGQVSHPAFRNASGTLLNALLGHAAGRWQPALVSRLDKDTSGLRARRQARARCRPRCSGSAIANRIEKDYLAIVSASRRRRGMIDLALDRDPWDTRRVTVRDRGGVPSVTTFRAFADVRHRSGPARLTGAVPLDHRAHASDSRASRGQGLANHRRRGLRHGTSQARLQARRVMAMAIASRQALHAWRLAFPHPSTAQRIDVTAAIPADMQQSLTIAEQRLSWQPLLDARQIEQHRRRAPSSRARPSPARAAPSAAAGRPR